MMSDHLLTTRLNIPPLLPDIVARPRLASALDESVRKGHRLTLVCAPAGFGKTTLMREWIEGIERTVVWLTVDEGLSDANSLLQHLSAGLVQTGIEMGQLPDPALTPTQAMVTLVNQVAASGIELLLVIDDYHLVQGLAAHDAISFLLLNQPANLHILLGTREDPPLPLARLRGRGLLTEIRERDLRFDTAEAGAFYSQTMGLSLAPASVATLALRTEGWITGLQLAGLALRESDDPASFVNSFSGDDRYIVDYLLGETLSGQPEAIQSFVRQTFHPGSPVRPAVQCRDGSR